LLGLAGGMLVVAGGFAGAYYVLGTKSVANAATPAPQANSESTPAAGQPRDVSALLAKQVSVKAGGVTVSLTWAELGAEADPAESARAGSTDLDTLAAKGQIPVRIDRDKAVKALLALKPKTDRAPIDAYLDLEERKIRDDRSGEGLDVWGSLPRIAAAARSGAVNVELATVAIPATVTKATLGIDDISNVLGTYVTKFPVADRDRNFNLKLAASKLNGVVLKPGVEFSFNETVGERSQKNGYKVAHVIQAGEMVDGLAGGTCQISTTLFGASFFAGLDIVKTINHSRPSAYTPLGFDATVVWPNTDLKMKNPYDFPVVVRYVVANGEAKVEILGKKRPWDKIVFTRSILEETPFESEERLDEEIALDETSFDQEGFPGYKVLRQRQFYKDGKLVADKTNKWVARSPSTSAVAPTRRRTRRRPSRSRSTARRSRVERATRCRSSATPSRP
jgi:vancomycin resistance protein YoaR